MSDRGQQDRSGGRRPSDSDSRSESRSSDSRRRSGRQQADSRRESGARQSDSRRQTGPKPSDSRQARPESPAVDRQPAEALQQESRPTSASEPQHAPPDTEPTRQPAEALQQESRPTPAPGQAPPADTEIPEGAELYTPPPDTDVHGRRRREGKTWKGVAGQRSSTIMNMKDDLDAGRLDVPPEEEIPYVVPGQSVNETSTDWSANVGKSDELAADTATPDGDKWGRKRKPSERR